MRIWIKALLAVLAITLLGWLAVRFCSFTLDVLSSNRGQSLGHDPQFAQPADPTEAPFYSSEVQDETVYSHSDNSAQWDTSVQTPVDKTADELQAEARTEN